MNQQRDMTGILFNNDRKDKPSQPDYTGKGTIEGKFYYMSGWIKDGKKGKFLSLAFNVPKPLPQENASEEDFPF